MISKSLINRHVWIYYIISTDITWHPNTARLQSRAKGAAADPTTSLTSLCLPPPRRRVGTTSATARGVATRAPYCLITRVLARTACRTKRCDTSLDAAPPMLGRSRPRKRMGLWGWVERRIRFWYVICLHSVMVWVFCWCDMKYARLRT
jgi:hypothetical protein